MKEELVQEERKASEQPTCKGEFTTRLTKYRFPQKFQLSRGIKRSTESTKLGSQGLTDTEATIMEPV